MIFCLIALLKDEQNVEEYFKDILKIKGFTGTDLCIAGALVGAKYGISIFDEKYINIVNNCNPSENNKQQRPIKYSPKNYDSLATQLIERSKKFTKPT